MQTCWWPLSDHWSVQPTSHHLSGFVFFGCLESLTELSALCIQIWSCFYQFPVHKINIIFSHCNSTAVMSCAKFSSDKFHNIWIRTKWFQLLYKKNASKMGSEPSWDVCRPGSIIGVMLFWVAFSPAGYHSHGPLRGALGLSFTFTDMELIYRTWSGVFGFGVSFCYVREFWSL